LYIEGSGSGTIQIITGKDPDPGSLRSKKVSVQNTAQNDPQQSLVNRYRYRYQYDTYTPRAAQARRV
jgi:hypothetical protein